MGTIVSETPVYVINILRMLAKLELGMQELYETFAKAIPEHNDLWLAMSSSEARHIKIVNELVELSLVYPFRLRQDSMTAKKELESIYDHVVLYIKEVRKSGISQKRAVAIAKEMEEGWHEKYIHTSFMVDEEKARMLLDRLQEDTVQHIRELEEITTTANPYAYLIERKLTSNIQIELARTIARKEGLSIEQALIQHFNIPKEEVLMSLSKFHHTKGFLPPPDFKIQPNLIPLIQNQYEMLKTRLFVPIEQKKGQLTVLMATASDLQLRDEIARIFPENKIEYRLSLPDDIIDIINTSIPKTRKSVSALLDELKRETTMSADDLAISEIKEEDSVIIRLVNYIVEEASIQGASDIHFEPDGSSPLTVRYRIDGVLRKIMECPSHYRRAIVARIKIMSSLDISERRKPQSGKISFRRWGPFDMDLRVEVYPTANGDEDVVMRLLKPGKPKPLSDLGLSAKNQKMIELILQKPYGLFLCVGPTGSGKTTTLHSALGILNTDELKIVTAEDPIEITQPKLRQLQVKPKIGLTFAEALRSFLRADPDVIMIGEMRDQETATIAVEASLTGHLVLSTLHTNSAPETITRLLDIGVDPFIFSDALLGVLAQRLVRKLCRHCCEPIDNKDILDRLEAEHNNPEEFRKLIDNNKPSICMPGNGKCDKCGDSHYTGRSAIHELLVISPAIRQMIVRKKTASEIREVAIKEGMLTLKQDGIEKILKGITTLEEVQATAIS